MSSSKRRSRVGSPRVWGEAAIFVLFASACAGTQVAPTQAEVEEAGNTGTQLAPTNDTERGVLARLSELPPNRVTHVGSSVVVAGPEYYSASNRRCRGVQIGADEKSLVRRLACAADGAWYFVPDVFERAQPKSASADVLDPNHQSP